MTEVLAPRSAYPIMQSEGNDTASPRPHSRRQQPRQPRQNHRPQPHEALSDSNIPTVTTPKSRKTPRHQNNVDRTSSLAVSSNRSSNQGTNQKHRPASVAVTQGNATATPSKPSYAGAAFHASPAPSSLPVPKFFSKSVPSANADSGLQAKLEREGDRSDSNEPPCPNLAPPPSRTGDKTPLDMFFNADRQEKARRQNGASESHTPAPNSRSETPNRSRDMFMLELDEASSPVASDHNTPTAVRRQPATDRSRHPPENKPSPGFDEARRAAQTQSLKSFLNITSDQSSGTPPARSPLQPSPQQHHLFSTPSHNQQQQDPSLLYGNRNLSPMFHAARTPPTAPSPSQQQAFSPPNHHVGHYASVYANPYSPSPSKPGPPGYNSGAGYPENRHHPVHSPLQTHAPAVAFPSGPSPQPQHNAQHRGSPHGTDGANDIKDMEDRMKRMLRMNHN
ncbi:hypothetical protein K461DRAFT_274314 [Myriangium duriaei CBS 260.36]|uniref:Uncharacterized protein n=1 Tax=Myriangium duriaei CBS 260.36 TaxID=1168546 RepID=A0A9P4JDE0_9PEZI|nr:hypothetical protein K461DRAFT_274314 [Myriangium duriaei CBS 260.36]